MKAAGGGAATIDRTAINEALELAASRCGRLTDDQVRALRSRRRAATAVVTTALSAAALMFVGVDRFTVSPARPAHEARILATLPGERGTATLPDGSTIKLNGASQVQIDYNADRRAVRLLAGQAFFDVRHDAARPFIVQAGPGEVRVLGTAFDVDMTQRQVSLAVYRGAVAFEKAATPHSVVVRAGYRSRIRDGAVEAPTSFDPSLPDWRQGWIDTSGMRLDELVDVLGRQSKLTIEPPMGALASITLVGRFRTDRPRELLDAIGDGFGFVVVEGPEGLKLRPRSGR